LKGILKDIENPKTFGERFGTPKSPQAVNSVMQRVLKAVQPTALGDAGAMGIGPAGAKVHGISLNELAERMKGAGAA